MINGTATFKDKRTHPTRESQSAHALVRATDIVKRFPDGTVALHGVSVECAPGELLVLVGPSGCGKTTLLRAIAGLEQPTSGQIHVGDREVTNVAPQDRGVAMVFQHYALYPDKTVEDNIAFPLRMARVPKAERAVRVREVARLLQIEQLLTRTPGQLSGGQKQRVGIGRALVRGPEVLLMDEPLSNLDAKLRVEMRAEIRALHQALGTTIVYVTHDQTEALTLADRICVLRDGEIEQLDRPGQVFERPKTAFVATFLGGMNLLEGDLDGNALRRGEHHLLALPESPTGPVKLGCRPEDIQVGSGSERDLTGTGRLVLRELLGKQSLLHVALPGDVIIRALVPADLPVEETVTLRARRADVHLFDAHTGARMPDLVNGTTLSRGRPPQPAAAVGGGA